MPPPGRQEKAIARPQLRLCTGQPSAPAQRGDLQQNTRQRRCLSHECSGNARQGDCLSHECSENTKQRQCRTPPGSRAMSWSL